MSTGTHQTVQAPAACSPIPVPPSLVGHRPMQSAVSALNRIVGRQSAALAANQRCRETLLNCYCREVAMPDGRARVGTLTYPNSWPAALSITAQHERAHVLDIELPNAGESLAAVVSVGLFTDNYRYLSPIFHKSNNAPWRLIEWESLAAVLFNEMALRHDLPMNDELMEQVRDSVEVSTEILTQPPETSIPAAPVAAFIDSEQSLTFGHPFHPAPKSRQGFSKDDLLRYSPELRTRFSLAWFSVAREDIAQQSLTEASCDRLVAAHAPAVSSDRVAVPVHPWQARYLRTLPLVRDALRCGRFQDLGSQGDPFFPTSSIRTVYQPGNPYFYKLSLNVRITNCVRKNAWYELESAMHIGRVLRPLKAELAQHFPYLSLLEEQAFLSVDLRDGDTEQNQQVIEAFGVILRQNIDLFRAPDVSPLVASSLFGNHTFGKARLNRLLDAAAARMGVPRHAIVEPWFSTYVEQLVYPVLHLYFAHGVIFEPHLQNVVLGFRHGFPTHAFLRDFEGVKLVRSQHLPASMAAMSDRARASVWYDEEQGWNRIAYCLFVNNLYEVIAQLGPDTHNTSMRLWSVVRRQLQCYQTRHGTPSSARRINALLAGTPFPAKTNFINRFLQQGDRAAAYVPVANPLGLAGLGGA
jgi:siderophore synthetase component